MLRVKIPATSANLGAGFDSLGLALDLYNYVDLEESDCVDIASLDGVSVPTGEDNLIYTTVKALYAACGKALPGLKVRQQNSIPMARGLGSSSACIIGGLVGANALLGDPMDRDGLLDLATKIEGHPDNVAPALMGGLVTSAYEGGRVYYVKNEVTAPIQFVAVIPGTPLKTADARNALPKQIDHKDGVFNLSRAALMVASLCSGKLENLRVACEDKLHQPYRLRLIPGAERVFSVGYGLGAYAAFISGAGSTLMLMAPAEDSGFAAKVEEALLQELPQQFTVKALTADNRGASIL